MTKLYFTLFFCVFTFALKAQTDQPKLPATEPYGKVSMADLEMKSCDFEPDANAEVLFDKASVISSPNLLMERHVRIKIFNDFGKSATSIRLLIDSRAAGMIDIKAETINLVNGKIETTAVDPKSIYTEKIDKQQSAKTFAFPNVKPGSIIEYKYSVYYMYFTIWAFQSNIPTRYSEVETVFAPGQDFKVIPHVKQPFVINKGFSDDAKQVKALANIHSLPDEPYMDGRLENLQRMEFLIFDKVPPTWSTIGNGLLITSDFGGQFQRSLSGEDDILKYAKSLKSDDEKIAYIFDKVKNEMKWNDILFFYSTIGTVAAWDKKTGNSTEINMIVYRLLKKAGIKAFPLVVGNSKYGKINPVNPSLFHFTNMDVYVPVDSVKRYVLDATNKYNLYNTIPANVLNTYALFIDDKNDDYQPIFLDNNEPAMQSVFLNAEIKPDGKMNGTVERTSYSYNKTNAIEKYKTDGEEKYIRFLADSDNNIKLTSVKLNDMEVDSLPLSLKADFTMDLGGGAENYIYFKTNLFMTMGPNPFLSENRFSDIDFGYRDNYSVSGIYKLPDGYKTDVLSKSVTIVMPDQSIIFKRTVVEDNGTIVIRYMLNHKKTIYFYEDYQDLRGFYNKMYELLNEQVALKKS